LPPGAAPRAAVPAAERRGEGGKKEKKEGKKKRKRESRSPMTRPLKGGERAGGCALSRYARARLRGPAQHHAPLPFSASFFLLFFFSPNSPFCRTPRMLAHRAMARGRGGVWRVARARRGGVRRAEANKINQK